MPNSRRAQLWRDASMFLATVSLIFASGACSEEGSPIAESLMPDSADVVAYGFTLHFTTDGVKRAQLEADSAFQYEDQEEWEMFNLRVEFRSPQGTLRSTLTSLRGTYNWSTNNMDARDSVVAVTPDGRRLTTCAIEYVEDSDIITGPCAFVFDAENEHLEGESFTADPDFRNVTAVRPSSGRVRDPNALPGN